MCGRGATISRSEVPPRPRLHSYSETSVFNRPDHTQLEVVDHLIELVLHLPASVRLQPWLKVALLQYSERDGEQTSHIKKDLNFFWGFPLCHSKCRYDASDL